MVVIADYAGLTSFFFAETQQIHEYQTFYFTVGTKRSDISESFITCFVCICGNAETFKTYIQVTNRKI